MRSFGMTEHTRRKIRGENSRRFRASVSVKKPLPTEFNDVAERFFLVETLPHLGTRTRPNLQLDNPIVIRCGLGPEIDKLVRRVSAADHRSKSSHAASRIEIKLSFTGQPADRRGNSIPRHCHFLFYRRNRKRTFASEGTPHVARHVTDFNTGERTDFAGHNGAGLELTAGTSIGVRRPSPKHVRPQYRQ